MNAHHYKAAYWVGQGVFNRLSSFSDFESRVGVSPCKSLKTPQGIYVGSKSNEIVDLSLSWLIGSVL